MNRVELSGHILGMSGASTVELGHICATHSPVAVKVKEAGHNHFDREVNALKQAGIPHMVGFRGVLGQRIVMDLARGVSLSDLMSAIDSKKPDLSEIKSIGKQLFEFLYHLSERRLIHGDIKNGNLMWDSASRTLTVIDFESTIRLDEDLGPFTPDFAPLEGLLGEGSDVFDIWSAGCVLFHLIVGERLFMTKKTPKQPEIRQLILQLTVEQFGNPSSDVLAQCRLAERYFDQSGKLKVQWSGERVVPWRDQVTSALRMKGASDDEVQEWLTLLASMLTYKNRATAEEILQSPLFDDDITVHVNFDPKIKCVFYISRASQRSPDLIIDPKVHKSFCLHFPKDPGDQYDLVVQHGKHTLCYDVKIENEGNLDLQVCQKELIQEITDNMRACSIRLLSSPSLATSYLSPELILGRTLSKEESDLWNVGCKLFAVITGEPLFSSQDEVHALAEIFERIGVPYSRYLDMCTNAALHFDLELGIPLCWYRKGQSKWRDAVGQKLRDLNMPPNEIDEWVDLMGRLLSYEDRGSASGHLQRSLFTRESGREPETKKGKSISH